MRNIKKLIVKYNGKVVGYLVDVNNKAVFQYDEQWIKTGFSISPIHLPLTNKIFNNPLKELRNMYGVFCDSLPDGCGELILRRMLTKKNINYDKWSPLQKLMLISPNGLGALTYEPSEWVEDDKLNIDLDELAKAVLHIYNDKETNKDLDELYCLGASSGGARPKAHVEINNEYYIVKFPCSLDQKDIGKKEYEANQLAKACGINVNEFKLFPSKTCSGYFGAKRFDRKGDKRVHMISLSSVLETTHRVPNLDYIHLLQVINMICCDKSDLYEGYRRMCFNVFYKNRDDHGKNFSFIYDNGYKLSPAYDLTSTNDNCEHEMTVNGKGKPTEKDLLDVAKQMKMSLSKCQEIINKVKQVLKKHNS